MKDEQLVNAIREGDDNAFRTLILRHESRVASTIIGMLGRCPEADDVGQETFIRFYKSLHQFRGESSVATYLTRIAINLSLNELKKRKRRQQMFSQNTLEPMEPGYQDDNLYNDEKELIHKAIGLLEPKFRSVIVLRLMDGYSTKETAEILKLPTGTVLSRLARAQSKLKKILAPYFGGKDEAKAA